jgi:hypothetical protein
MIGNGMYQWESAIFHWAPFCSTKLKVSASPLSNGQPKAFSVKPGLPQCPEPSRRHTSGKIRMFDSSVVPFDKSFRRVDIAQYDLRMSDAKVGGHRF